MLAKYNCVSKCQVWSLVQLKLGTLPKNPEEFGSRFAIYRAAVYEDQTIRNPRTEFISAVR